MAYQDSDRQELDYSASSTGRGSTDGEYDATSGDYHHGRDVTETTMNPDDGPPLKVTRDGEVHNKWAWLAQLNDGRWAQNRREQNAHANMERDVNIVCKRLDDAHDRAPLDKERVLLVIEQARRDRESGLQFGRDKPLEATILAAVSLVANERDWPIRRTDTFEDLRENFTPNDMTVEAGDIRYLRKVLRQHL